MSPSLPSFETLSALAASNPDEFERLREEYVKRLIDSAPTSVQRRLRGIQFQVDCQRRLHKHPMAACLAISRMMHDSLNQLNQALHGSAERETMESPAKVLSMTHKFASAHTS